MKVIPATMTKTHPEIKTAEDLAKWINRRPYCSVGGETHIDGDWVSIAVYVPVGHKRGIRLVLKAMKLFLMSAWAQLS